MDAPPRLTVALPTCNGARHISEAIRSVLAQQGPAFDLLVCDDRSDDETLSLIRAEAGDRARIEVNSERLGLAGNWNRCVEQGRSDWVAVFHQDDIMLPGHLAASASAIGDDPEGRPGLVIGKASVIDDAGRTVSENIVEAGCIDPEASRVAGAKRSVPRKGGATLPGHAALSPGHTMGPRSGESAVRWFAPGEFAKALAVGNPVRCSAVTIRKAAHAEAGGFDSSYRYAVDWDFWLRVSARWGVSALLGPPTVAFRWHLASETHRFKGGTADLDEQVALLERLFARDGADWAEAPRLRRDANRRLSRAFLNRAYEASRSGDAALCRSCLFRSLRLWPGIAARILADPRLLARLAIGARP